MSTPGIQMHEHVASVSVANGMPYEHGPIQMLTCRHKPSLILEASEQVFGTWPTTMPHVWTATALGSLASSYSISILLQQGSILVCKYDGHEQHSIGSTSRARRLDMASSLTLCAVSCRVLNYSISSPPQLAPNAIIICNWLEKCWTHTLSATWSYGRHLHETV